MSKHNEAYEAWKNCSLQRKGKWVQGRYDANKNRYNFVNPVGNVSDVYGCSNCNNEAYWSDYGQVFLNTVLTVVQRWRTEDEILNLIRSILADA